VRDLDDGTAADAPVSGARRRRRRRRRFLIFFR